MNLSQNTAIILRIISEEENKQTNQCSQHSHINETNPCLDTNDVVQDTISESLSDFAQKDQTPVEALWSLRSIDLRVIALHPSFVKLRMPQNASLVPLISEPIRVNVISFVIYKRGNSQYPEQDVNSTRSCFTDSFSKCPYKAWICLINIGMSTLH